MGTIVPSTVTRRRYAAFVGFAVFVVASAGGLAWLRIESTTAGFYTLGVTGVASGSLLVIGAVTSRQLVGPLGRLRIEVESRDGDSGTITEGVDRSDEFGKLSRGIDALARSGAEARSEYRNERERRQELETRLEAVEDTVDAYCRTLRRRSDDTLTHRLDTEVASDELSALASAFNDRLAELETTVDRVSELTADIHSSVDAITDGTTDLGSTDRQVTESVSRISDRSGRQRDELDTVTETLDELASTVQQIAATSNRVAEIAQQTAETGQNGSETAETAIDGMEAIEQETREAVSQLRKLEAEVAQIDELTARIADVARETNMLALNANIEASRSDRSGDGQGFGVVASEVKELSTDVQEAAEEIERRLESIRTQAGRSVTQVEKTSDHVEQVKSRVETATTALSEITELAERTTDGVQRISQTTRTQATTTEEIVSMIEEARTIADSIEDETRAAATVAHDRRDASAGLSRNADDLTRQIDRLQAAVEHCAIPEAAAPGDRPLPLIEAPENEEVDAYELKRAVIDAHSGTDTPWHTFGRIELETGCDLASVSPGETITEDRFDAVRSTAEELFGHGIEPHAEPAIPLDEE
jgi:methyl-accepting chemotaxis protein